MRDLDLNVLNGLDNEHIAMAILGEFDFSDGVQNLWAGPEGHAIEYDGQQWTSVGDLGQIDKLAEGQGLADSRTTVALNLSSEQIDVLDVQDSRGRPATIILVVMSDEGTTIGDIRFLMTMGAVNITAAFEEDEERRRVVHDQISLELLNETATLGNSHFVRMTYEAGLRIDPNDHGLEFVSDPDIGNVGLFTGTPGPGGRPRRGLRIL